MAGMVVVGTDPNDVDVAGAIVVVPGIAAAERVRRRGGIAVIARPDALPLSGGAAVVRADGLFVTPPPAEAARLVAELVRVAAVGGEVVVAAQIDSGPVGARRPVDAAELARMLPSTPSVEPFHDRVCRKDWHRLVVKV